MCGFAPGVAALVSGLGTIGQVVGVAGTALSMYGQVQQGKMTRAAMQQQSAQIETQKQEAAQLASIEEWRTREKMKRQMRQQQATIGARGFDLGSPTALYLAQQAGQEMAFEGAAIRQGASSTQRELTANQRVLDARGRMAVYKGRVGAAGTLLKQAPDLWPDLLS
ncbi:hypothetical protein CDO87_03410 [Sagittula sp. P11]|uniref:hypothetical protein n=1 Tax=Sagittula sp. P11 TaxID=2009329 RepID=UPI000C2D0A98|nr:hypothetical protein [Sagittula sp. P11]AUC52293.1 hypothetical protein CDO87_03410 [Sagittula sp. P11]